MHASADDLPVQAAFQLRCHVLKRTCAYRHHMLNSAWISSFMPQRATFTAVLKNNVIFIPCKHRLSILVPENVNEHTD